MAAVCTGEAGIGPDARTQTGKRWGAGIIGDALDREAIYDNPVSLDLKGAISAANNRFAGSRHRAGASVDPELRTQNDECFIDRNQFVVSTRTDFDRIVRSRR